MIAGEKYLSLLRNNEKYVLFNPDRADLNKTCGDLNFITFVLMDKPVSDIVVVGSGNVAYHLVRAIRHAGGKTVQLYARSSQKARLIADKFGVSLVTDLASVKPDADLYVLAVKDDALGSTAREFPFKDRLVVHTSGATPMEVLDPASSRKGVFYPLQTFTFGRDIDFQGVPVCLEASGREDLDLLRGLARELSGNTWEVNSVQRLHLHLAAVIAANFTHHMYTIASHILDGQGIPFGILGPLIQETATKALYGDPRKHQTGPAVRNDKRIIRKHLEMLEAEEGYREIYRLVTEDIIKELQKNGKKL